ncbi:hypothetical protein [Streptomyces sp. NPDC006335]|uniref:hypothetical protein n=1 Tax=Streptomyces sp. NPDC006335 TaxID=3156895 RepID=UPI0033BE7BD9
MALPLFTRTRPVPVIESDPEPWSEIGETWMPEGITVVERYWNQANAVVLVYSGDESCYYHVVTCLGCHFNVAHDPDGSRDHRLTLNDAGRVANEHATTCRALSRTIPDRPNDDDARDQLRKTVLGCQLRDKDAEIHLSAFDLGRLTLQRTNGWIETELQQLAADRPDLVVAQTSYGTPKNYFVLPRPEELRG